MLRLPLLRTVGVPLSAACAFAAVALTGGSARAGDKVAIACAEDPYYCQTAPIAFDHTDALPVEWNFDTGWVPQNSPLQLHIWAGVYAHTRVALSGQLVTSWEAEKAGLLGLETPGDPYGGMLAYHYGAELGAQGAVHISILGQQYDWIGDLPYIPQFDFQLDAKEKFDAWAFPPGFALASKTEQQKLAQISIGSIIGASIPGVDGGFELDVAMELKATYVTNQIVMTEADKPVSGGPITTDDGLSSMGYKGGAFTLVDVHPEGTVDYDGTLHLIPAFYISVLGQNWSIPIADIPIAFPITQTTWSFDPVRIRTPLPDLYLPVTEVSFGKVEVGQKNLEAFDLTNAGEAKLAIAMAGDNDAFEVWDPTIEIDAGDTIQSAFRFVPKQAGEYTAIVLVSSNDPDAPLQKVLLKGTGVDGPGLVVETEESDDFDSDIEEPASCACRTTGKDDTTGGSTGGMALFALGAALMATRSRRRRQ